jgi:glycosyltransferase involved in cell wall biosynthesis
MLDPVGGVSEVRVVQPLQALATDPSLITRIVAGAGESGLPANIPEVFILHRPALVGEGGLETLRQMHARHRLIVVEFDDHPDYIPILQRPDVYNFIGAHAIQTTTEPLAALLRQQNPEVMVFPNALPRLPDVRNFQRPDRLTLFFGGINRDQDWPPILEALNAVAAMAGDRLQFRIVADRALFDALETPFKEFTPLCDYATYLQLLSTSEICLMPLTDTPFNRCKSDLKFLEASASRVAALASHIVYGGTIEDGRTGVLFLDGAELRQRLLRMIANPDMARAVADRARAHVAAHRMMAYQVARRVEWYRTLLARREELHVALLARMPQLRAPEPAESLA